MPPHKRAAEMEAKLITMIGDASSGFSVIDGKSAAGDLPYVGLCGVTG